MAFISEISSAPPSPTPPVVLCKEINIRNVDVGCCRSSVLFFFLFQSRNSQNWLSFFFFFIANAVYLEDESTEQQRNFTTSTIDFFFFFFKVGCHPLPPLVVIVPFRAQRPVPLAQGVRTAVTMEMTHINVR